MRAWQTGDESRLDENAVEARVAKSCRQPQTARREALTALQP
jgi:hypothetical protein